MSTWIALLRGINVGGRHTVRMADLRKLLGELGLENVRTYIQSGNVVFDAAVADPEALADRISDAIGEGHNFRPHVQVFSADHLERAMRENPFPEAESAPKTLHLFFLATPPVDPDLERLDAAKAPSERYHLGNRIFYLHAPDGIGRSKLVTLIERCLRVDMTARNWRTVEKVMELTRG